jgi:hypothetical protein
MAAVYVTEEELKKVRFGYVMGSFTCFRNHPTRTACERHGYRQVRIFLHEWERLRALREGSNKELKPLKRSDSWMEGARRFSGEQLEKEVVAEEGEEVEDTKEVIEIGNGEELGDNNDLQRGEYYTEVEYVDANEDYEYYEAC